MTELLNSLSFSKPSKKRNSSRMKKASKEEMQNMKVLLVFAALITVANMILLVSLHPDKQKTALLGIALAVLLTFSICIDKRTTHITRGYVLTVSGIYFILSAVPFVLLRDLWFIGVWSAEILLFTFLCFLLLKKKGKK